MIKWPPSLARVGAGLLDVIYPSVCHGCDERIFGGGALCEDCRASLVPLSEPFCERCGMGFDAAVVGAHECSNCRDQAFAFDFARPGVSRSDLSIELVRGLKYKRRLDMAEEVSRMALRAFDDPRLEPAKRERWPLVPVPLHWRRRSWRQFNQARELARPLAEALDMPLVDGLKRIRSTVNQTRLTRSQRQKNLRGAFAVTRQFDPSVPGVVLVDDVFTTGSTAHECARVLRRAGAQKVIVVTALRG